MTKLTHCPICGYRGEDLLFKFYCSNSECINYKKEDRKEEKTEEIKEEKKSSWKGMWPFYSNDDD